MLFRSAETAIFLKNVPAIAKVYRREFSQLYREDDIGFDELNKKRAERDAMHRLLESTS